LAETIHAGHARAIAAEAVQRGTNMLVAAGGDGTIAGIAAAMLGGGARLGLLPLGTADVLANELGVPLRPQAAAAVLLAGSEVMLHPGIARWADGRGRLFVQMLGASFDAALVQALDPSEKRRLGRGAHLLESPQQLRAHDFPTIGIALDGGNVEPAASVIISQGRFYAGRYCCLPGADPLAPGFSVRRSRHGGAAAAMLAGLSLPLHLSHRLPGAQLLPARNATLHAECWVSAQADGDAAGSLPLSVHDAQHAIPFVIPTE